MQEKETIELLVEGGKASPGPSTAPRLSAFKLNINEVFKKINEATKEYAGIKVPVKIIIDKTSREYELKIGVPPVSSLIKKELGIEKAKITEEKKEGEKSEETKEEVKGEEKEEKDVEEKIVGNLSFEQVVKIAKMKRDDMLAKDLKSTIKQVVGTVGSMTGIRIEGKKAKEILIEIEEGKYDNLLTE